MMHERTHNPITHPVIMFNPKYYSTARQTMAELQHSRDFHALLVVTDPNPEENAKTISTILESEGLNPSKAVIGVVGGDGTFALTINSLRETSVQSKTKNQLAACALAGGYAGDMRAATHRKRNRLPSEKIHFGRVISAHAIERTLTSPDRRSTATDTAYLYAGFGATGYGAELANTSAGGSKYTRAASIALKTLLSDTRASVAYGGGVLRETYADITATVSSRMSMSFRPKTDVRHGMLRLITTPQGVLQSTFKSIQFAQGFDKGVSLPKIQFELLSDALAHIDGEPPTVVPANSYVSLRISPYRYPLLVSEPFLWR